MRELIIYVETSEVREGKLAALESAVKRLVAFVATNEPLLPAFEVYFDAMRRKMTVIHVHRDAASLDQHMRVLAPVLSEVAELAAPSTIDVYGKPSARALERLWRSAQTMGPGAVRVHALHAGTRLARATARRRAASARAHPVHPG